MVENVMPGDFVLEKEHVCRIITASLGGNLELVRMTGRTGPFFSHSDYTDPIPLTREIMEANGAQETEQQNTLVFTDFIGRTALRVKLYGRKGCSVILGGIYYKLLYVHEFQHVLRLCGFDEFANNFKLH